MAITTEYSTEYASAVNSKTPVKTNQWHGRLRCATFEFTQGAAAGDAGSLAYVIQLPPGKVRVMLPLSFVGFSALGALSTMDIGWAKYTGLDGVSVAADPNGLDDGISTAAAGTVVPGGTVGGGENYEFSSQSGVDITLQINDDVIPAAATLKGFFTYVVD